MHTTLRPPMVIGLTGEAGAGKDTCAALLRPYGFMPIAFADELRREIAEAYVVPNTLLLDRETKEQPSRGFAVGRCRQPGNGFIQRMYMLGHDLDEPRSPRWIMQRWGTEYRRHENEDYWCYRMARTLGHAMRRGIDRIVVTDLRFSNEVATIRAAEGQVLRIARASSNALASETRGHVSEGLLHLPVNATIRNDGTIDELRDQVVTLIGLDREPLETTP